MRLRAINTINSSKGDLIITAPPLLSLDLPDIWTTNSSANDRPSTLSSLNYCKFLLSFFFFSFALFLRNTVSAPQAPCCFPVSYTSLATKLLSVSLQLKVAMSSPFFFLLLTVNLIILRFSSLW